MLNCVHVMECMQVLVITCMALLWLSGAVHGYERGTARSGVLEMCGNELEVIMVARMSTELCSCYAHLCECNPHVIPLASEQGGTTRCSYVRP